MKRNILTTATCLLALTAIFTACNDSDAKFEDLNTGKKVHIIQNENGEAIDSLTKEPVDLYVNLETKDTIFGKTGAVVNNAIIKTEDGKYEVNQSMMASDDNMIDIGDGDAKIKIDGDEMKIKTDEKKIKIDGDETKVKYND